MPAAALKLRSSSRALLAVSFADRSPYFLAESNVRAMISSWIDRF